MSISYKESRSNNDTRNIDSSFTGSPSTQVVQTNPLKSAVGNVSSLVKSTAGVVSGASSILSEAGILGLNVTSAFTNTNQYEELLDAAGNSVQNYLNNKINRIKDLWNTKVDVTIQSIVGEVAPYALKMENIGSNLDKKITKMMGFILGTGSNNGDYRSLLNDLGQDALDSLKSDSSLNKSISSLSAVQAYANTFNIISQGISVISKIKTIYETIQPVLSISSNLALTFWSCGTSAAEASNTMVEEVEKSVSVIETMILFAVKKLLFPLTIKLPALIVGAVDTISVRSAMLGLGEEYGWLGTLFNDDFWNDLEYTLSVSDSISEALSAIKTAKNSIESDYNLWVEMGKLLEDDSRAGLSRGDIMKNLFMKEFTKSYMGSVSASARKTAYIPNYSSVSYFSKKSDSDQYSSNATSANTPVSMAVWRYQRNDYSKQNPIKNLESLVKISKTLYENI